MAPSNHKGCLHLIIGCLPCSLFITVAGIGSEHTLRDYTHIVSGRAGFYPKLNIQLLKKLTLMRRTLCGMIKEGLVFDKHNIKLVGSSVVATYNTYLDNLERLCK